MELEVATNQSCDGFLKKLANLVELLAVAATQLRSCVAESYHLLCLRGAIRRRNSEGGTEVSLGFSAGWKNTKFSSRPYV